MCNEGNMKFKWIKETETLCDFRLHGPMTQQHYVLFREHGGGENTTFKNMYRSCCFTGPLTGRSGLSVMLATGDPMSTLALQEPSLMCTHPPMQTHTLKVKEKIKLKSLPDNSSKQKEEKAKTNT